MHYTPELEPSQKNGPNPVAIDPVTRPDPTRLNRNKKLSYRKQIARELCCCAHNTSRAYNKHRDLKI